MKPMKAIEVLSNMLYKTTGNEATYTREIRVVGKDGPLITLKNGSEGKNFSYASWNSIYRSGYVATDITMIMP